MQSLAPRCIQGRPEWPVAKGNGSDLQPHEEVAFNRTVMRLMGGWLNRDAHWKILINDVVRPRSFGERCQQAPAGLLYSCSDLLWKSNRSISSVVAENIGRYLAFPSIGGVRAMKGTHTNADFRKLLGWEPIAVTIRKQTLVYLGHVGQYPDNGVENVFFLRLCTSLTIPPDGRTHAQTYWQSNRGNESMK